MNLKAYPESWATNDACRAAAARWQRQGLLSPVQRSAIEAASPSDYFQPVWWLRVGLFLAACFGISSAAGFLVLLTEFKGPLATGIVLLLGSVATLELFIRSSRHYRSGLDNALLYTALLAWGFVVGYSLADSTFDSLASRWLWGWLLLVLAALVLALLRYADALVAAATFAVALALLANLLLQSSWGRLLLPFAGMAAAGALLLALRPVPARADYWYYRSAYLTLRALALAVLYLAGNYLVVREGNAALLGGGSPSAEIPFAGLFWFFTFAVPLLYLVLGLRRHDRLLLWLGVLALAFSVFTVRIYHSLLPPALAATLAGTVLLAVALLALRYFRTPRHGLTAQADDEVRPPVNLESFITLETAHVAAAPVPGFEFGGGHTGGGGAEGQY